MSSTMRGSREGGGGTWGPNTPLPKNHKDIESLSNTGPNSQKYRKAAK